MMDTTNRFGALPTRNARDVSFDGVPKINADAMLARRPTDSRANLLPVSAAPLVVAEYPE